MGYQGCKEIHQKVLEWSMFAQTEALIIAQDIFLTRFYNSTINQNVSENWGILFTRQVMLRWIAPALTHRFDNQAIQRGLERLTQRAQLRLPFRFLRFRPHLKSLQPITFIYNKTARYSPSQRTEDPKGLSQILGERTFPFIGGAKGMHKSSK